MIAHRRFRFGPRLVAISAFFALAPGAAMAYIDPGTGAYMVQAIFTIVGAALFYLRHPSRLVYAITRWVRGRSKDVPSAPTQDAE